MNVDRPDSVVRGRVGNRELTSIRCDHSLIRAAQEAAFAIVDADPGLADHPSMADESDMIFSDRDEEFLSRG